MRSVKTPKEIKLQSQMYPGCLSCLACLVTQSCLTLGGPLEYSPGSSVHGIFSGKNIGVGCHFLLQGIFPAQGWNPYFLCLLRGRQILYPLSHPGSPCDHLASIFLALLPSVWATLVGQFFFLCDSSNRSGLVSSSFSNLEGKDFIQRVPGLPPLLWLGSHAHPIPDGLTWWGGYFSPSQPRGLRTEVPPKENWGVFSRNTWKWMLVRNTKTKSREPLESISPFYRWKTWGLEMVKVLAQEMEQPSHRPRIWSQVYVKLDLYCFKKKNFIKGGYLLVHIP